MSSGGQKWNPKIWIALLCKHKIMLHAIPSHLAWFNIRVNEKYEQFYVIQAKDYYHLFDSSMFRSKTSLGERKIWPIWSKAVTQIRYNKLNNPTTSLTPSSPNAIIPGLNNKDCLNSVIVSHQQTESIVPSGQCWILTKSYIQF